jgi:hypothetical protein
MWPLAPMEYNKSIPNTSESPRRRPTLQTRPFPLPSQPPPLPAPYLCCFPRAPPGTGASLTLVEGGESKAAASPVRHQVPGASVSLPTAKTITRAKEQCYFGGDGSGLRGGNWKRWIMVASLHFFFREDERPPVQMRHDDRLCKTVTPPT